MAETTDCSYLIRAHQLCTALNNAMMYINSSLDVQEILQRIVEETGGAIGSESARIALREDDRWAIGFVFGLPGESKGKTFSDEELPHASLAMITKRAVAIDDAPNDHRTNTDIMNFYGIRSVLAVPLMEDGSVLGVLLFNYHSAPVVFTEVEIEYAEKVAIGVSIALRNANRLQNERAIKMELEEFKRLSDALTRINHAILSTHDRHEIISHVLRKTAEAIGAETAMLFSKEEAAWQVRHVHKLSRTLIGRCFSDEEVKHTAITAQTKEPLAIEDTYESDQVNGQFVRMLGIRSLLNFPLIVNDRIIGDLVFHHHSRPTVFSQNQINFVRKIQSAISMGMENASLFEALQQSMGRLEEAEKLGKFGYFHFDRYSGKLSWSEGLFSLLRLDPSLGEPSPEEFCRAHAIEPGFEEMKEKVLREDTSEFDATVTVNGNPVILHINVRSMKDPRGNITARLGTVQDVTEQRSAQEMLQRSESFKRAILDSIPAHIAVIDGNGTVIDVNGRWITFAEENGLSDASKVSLGVNYLEVCRKAVDMASPLAGEALEGIAVVLEGSAPSYSLEYPCDSPAQPRWFLMSVFRPMGEFSGAVISHFDISPLKLTEAALRESERRYRTLFESMDEGFCIIEMIFDERNNPVDYRFLETNPAFDKQTGLADARGKTMRELAGKLEEHWFQVYGQIALTGEPARFQAKAEQLHRWFDVFAFRFGEPGKRQVAVLFNDVSDRKRAEKNLIQAKEEWEMTFNSVPDLIAVLDEQHRIVRVNKLMAERLGRQPEEFVGQACYEVMHRTHGPPDFCPHATTLADGKVHHVQVNEPSLGGDFLISSTPLIGTDGKIHGVVHVARDITEQKRATAEVERLNTDLAARAMELEAAERRLKTVIQNLAEGLLYFNPDGTQLNWNPAALELYNLQPGQEPSSFLGLADAYELTTPEGAPVPIDSYPISCVIRGETFRDRELWIRNRQTNWRRIFSYSGVLVRGWQAEPVMGLLTVRDITERRRAEESLQASKAELERLLAEVQRSNQDLQQFAYVASHDLQEPLRMVSGFMELLEKKYQDILDEKAKTYIEHAVDGAKRMQSLIEGLLKYSRIAHAEFGWVDTNVTFADAVANLATALGESGAAVTGTGLPTVWGDATQMLQLFQNLISNGIKYRKPDVPPRVEVSAERKNREWVFLVKDNGIGIQAHDFDRVFQIFQRLHTRDEYPGTGIGLASCKKIVEQHGGRIWIESTPGEGSTFYFSLPATGAQAKP